MSGMSKYSRVLSLLLGGALWVGGSGAASAAPEASVAAQPACSAELWAGETSKIRLRQTAVRRKPQWITTEPPMKGQIHQGTLTSIFSPDVCTDTYREQPEETAPVQVEGVYFSVLATKDAGKSGRDWPGRQCTIGISRSAQEAPQLVLGPDVLPPFNTIWHVVRDGDRLFVSLNANGYAKEFPEGSNRIVAVDLCTQKVQWVSKDLRNNGPMMLVEDAIITGYGFTAEKDYLYVLDAHTGKELQKLPLVKAPSALALEGDRLTARIYDGVVDYKVQGLAQRAGKKKAGQQKAGKKKP